MREMIAAIVAVALLASAGYARPVTEDSGGSGQEPTWVMKEYTDDPCTHPLLSSPKSIRSPSGRWTIHCAYDEQGTTCLVDSLDGSHRNLFVFADHVPADEYQEMLWREGWCVGTEQAFWAGDESGVYLWYPSRLQKLWYVTVPDGTVYELGSRKFFNSRDLTRMVLVLGSPIGSRNLVVMEQYVDWECPDMRKRRLVVMDPDGQELTSIVEFDTVDTWAEALATPEAVMLFRGPTEKIVVNRTILSTSEVWLYHPSPDGWEGHRLGRLSSTELRKGSVTSVKMISDRPHLVETTLGKPDVALFELPQPVIDATIGWIRYRWCTNGNHVFFPGSGVMMESLR